MGLGASSLEGYKSALGVAKEDAWGTEKTATAWAAFNGDSMTKKKEPKLQEAIGSTGRNFIKRYLGNTTVEGSVEMPLNIFADACLMFINQAFGGSVASSGDASSGFNHVPAQGSMDSGTVGLTLTKQIGDSGDLFRFAGCRVNTLTIKGEVGTPEVMLSAELIGKDGTITTDAMTVVLAAEDPLLWSGITLEVADTVSSFDGSTNVETIQAFELVYSNNLEAGDDARNLGSELLGVLPVNRATCSLKTTQRYDTSTAYTRAFDETLCSVRISMDTGVTLGTEVEGTTGSIMFTLPKAYAETENTIPETGDPGIVSHETTWTPIQPTTGQNLIDCEYNNNTASY